MFLSGEPEAPNSKAEEVFFLEGHQIPSGEAGYSGHVALEDVCDDSTDLAGPNKVEPFNLALGSFTLCCSC